jgi:RimJ/RimL family protein N-acetyltransferase
LNNPAEFKQKWFDKAIRQMQEGKRLAFKIEHLNKLVGSSSFYEIDVPNKSLKIGYTWFHPDSWGKGINSLSKGLMLQYAFEKLGVNRAAFSIDSANERSCKAVEKLGAVKEGVLRHDMVRPDGSLRSTVSYSILKEEWPAIKMRVLK